MIALIRDARAAMGGLFGLLAFKEDWRAGFDVSSQGVARSFAAAILALPAFILFVLSANYFVAAQPEAPETARYTPLEAVLSYARIWLVFPLVAALLTWVMGETKRFAAWLVVHNWAVFALLHLAALIYVLYPAGLSDLNALALFSQFYFFIRLFVHWRVAWGALDRGPAMGAVAAAIPVLADFLLINLT